MCVALVTWCVVFVMSVKLCKLMNLLRYFNSASTVASTNNDGDNPSVGYKRPQRESQTETSSQENGNIKGRGGFLRFCFLHFE